MLPRILFFLSGLCFSLFAIANDSPPAVIQIAEAKNTEMAPLLWVTAAVISRFDSEIAAEVEGNLTEVLEVGERVNKNDIIAKIAAGPYQLELNQVNAEIVPIAAMVEFYKRESARLEKLALKNNAAKSQLDQVQTNRDEALARIQVKKAEIALAQDRLNKTVIRAPFNGIIAERFKLTGERVEAGDEIVRLINTNQLEVSANIQHQSFQFIKPNQPLTIRHDDNDDETVGYVRTIIPIGDNLSRLYEIRLEFNNQNWLVGNRLKVAVPIAKKRAVIAVPRDALVIRQAGIIVYKINEQNLAEVVPVKTGVANTTHIEIIGNINQGDKIVIRGNERLRPGQKVRIINGSQ